MDPRRSIRNGFAHGRYVTPTSNYTLSFTLYIHTLLDYLDGWPCTVHTCIRIAVPYAIIALKFTRSRKLEIYPWRTIKILDQISRMARRSQLLPH